jgi:hypothetical protein
MADITNPEAIAFCNEILRPLCERLRALDYKLQADIIKWNEVKVNAGIPNDTSPIVDGRPDCSPLVGSDLYNVMSTISGAFQNVFGTGNYRIYIAKPCVRVFEAT